MWEKQRQESSGILSVRTWRNSTKSHIETVLLRGNKKAGRAWEVKIINHCLEKPDMT